METKFNFNSQVCTDKIQSERLLSLGLKKETADCYLFEYDKEKYKVIAESWLDLIADEKYYSQYKDVCFPAWSLHRLIDMADTTTYINEGREDEHELWFCMDKCYCWNNHESFYSTNLYDSLINCIEWLIKEGYYLV